MFIVKVLHRKLERKHLNLGWFHCMAVPHGLASQDVLGSACRRWWEGALGQHSTNLCQAGSPWDEGKDRRAWLSLKRAPVTVQFRLVNSWVCRVINISRCVCCVCMEHSLSALSPAPLLCPRGPPGPARQQLLQQGLHIPQSTQMH